ncbi:MAG: hypothetical protein BalsKO_16830 [Balneolaceae bacterium]
MDIILIEHGYQNGVEEEDLYFALGAITGAIALVLMPNSPALWIAVGVLWIMDASINITMEPFRAFVGDLLPDEQRTSALRCKVSLLELVLLWHLSYPGSSPIG